MRRRKNVDIAEHPAEQCESVSPNGRRCCYVRGHETRRRPEYHCCAHGLESWEANAPVDDRCPFLDRAGCRCLLHRDHGGVHDPSYTVYAEVLKVRAEMRLEALRRAAEAKP